MVDRARRRAPFGGAHPRPRAGPGGRGPERGPGAAPPAPALVPVAEAYTAAWNAHDLPAVLALFAPDAVVRERRGAVPPEVWDTRDPQVVRAYLEDSDYGDAYDAGGLAWARGHQQIAAWAAAHFARHQRLAAEQPRAAGDTVGWQYREFVDPLQGLPGVGPLEGTRRRWCTAAGSRGSPWSGRPPPCSGSRARSAAYGARALATRRAAPHEDGRRGPPSGPPHGGRRRRSDDPGLAPGAGRPRRPGRRHRGAAPTATSLRRPRVRPQGRGIRLPAYRSPDRSIP